MITWSFPTLCLLILSFISKSISLSLSTNVIHTSSGPVRGTVVRHNRHEVEQYLGVPFAEPPVGDLRFQKPQPVEPWKETLFANTLPPACVQYLFEYRYPWYDFQDGKNENCLYLNIWVPKTSTRERKKLPTMFWIHGGVFNVGSSRKPIYDGHVLAALGEVIVVTINYRLGVLGFLTSNSEEAPGNAGMYDILEALKWINENIEAFGGDPENITLFGQSAGSISIGLFCVSPLTKGLFKRVIMESGSQAYLLAEDSTANLKNSQKLAKAVGCADNVNTIENNPKQVVNCLKGIDPFDLTMTYASFVPYSDLFSLPMYGDEIFPRNPREALIDGDFHDVDVLIGTSRDEGSFQITVYNPEVFDFYGHNNARVNKTLAMSLLKRIEFLFGEFPDLDAIFDYYIGNLQENNYYRIRHQVYTASGDYILHCPTVYFAESYSKAGNNVYFYSFKHRPSTTLWAEWMGVAHFEEVQFVFGIPLQMPSNYTKEEQSLSRRMIKIWSTFAKNGEPPLEIRWPKYSREDPTYVALDTSCRKYKLGKGPHKENCDFFRIYFGFD